MDSKVAAQLVCDEQCYDFHQVFQLVGNITSRILVVESDRAVRRVFILANSPLALLAGFITCQRQKWEAIILDTESPIHDYENLLRTGAVDCIFGERAILNTWNNTVPFIYLEDCTGDTTGEVPNEVCAIDVTHAFKIITGGGKEDSLLSVSPEAWSNTAKDLDNMFKPRKGDTLLIDGGLSFHIKIINLLWGFQRGLKIIMSDRGSDLVTWIPCPKELQMEFSLFYFGSPDDGISTPDKYKLLLDTVRFADANEFAGVWTPERHFNQFGGLFPNPSVLSAALAVATKKLQIRSGSIVSPLHHSVRIAEDWSIVDNLSGGRVAISFASGWQCDDFVFFPDRYKDRHQVMLEQIQTVLRLWRGEPLLLPNGLGKEIKVSIYPKPVQSELPVWITVSGKTESFIDAGKIGANVLTHLLWQDTSELIDKIKAYRHALEVSGYDPSSRKVAVMAHTFLGTDLEAVRKQVEVPLKNYIKSSVHLIETMTRTNNDLENQLTIGRYGNVTEEMPPHLLDQLLDIAFERFFANAGLLGTEDTCRKMVLKLKEYDVDEVACLIDFHSDGEHIQISLEHLNRIRHFFQKTHDVERRIFGTLAASSYQRIKTSDLLKQLLKDFSAVVIENNLEEIVQVDNIESTGCSEYVVRCLVPEPTSPSSVLCRLEQIDWASTPAAEKFMTEVSTEF